MRITIFMLCVSLLVFSACSVFAPQQQYGMGIETHIVNQYEFEDVYFQHAGSSIQGASPSVVPPTVLDASGNPDADLRELFRLHTVVANTGRADGLAAVYVTGYDPNLFVVSPLGPYRMNRGVRSCWQWTVGVSDNRWDGYIACLREEDMFGVGVAWDDDNTALRLDTRDVNAANLLNQIPRLWREEPTTFFDGIGLFEHLDISCNLGGERTEGLFGFGGASSGCSFNLNIPTSFLNRPSRGALTTALYGAMVRDCSNGCILVPSPLQTQDYIGGDTELTPGGERLNLDIGVWVDRNRWPENYNDHDQLFQVSTCSLYTTYITPSVCIDPTPGADSICRGVRNSLEQNQGAPVRISRIDQVNQGPRVVFTFHVENVGDGRIFHPGGIDMCSPATPDMLSREMRDVAVVTDARLIGTLDRLDCGDDVIRFRDGRGQITCSVDLNRLSLSAGAYQSALNVEIGYLYREQQAVSSTITRI